MGRSLVFGMIFNICCTDADLMNGARGKIVDIVLDPREDQDAIEGSMVTLKFPSTMILFKLENLASIKFPGLAFGLIPIFPTESTFTITTSSGANTTVTRHQVALTASYCITNYRSQGQTIEHIVVDLGKVPSSTLLVLSMHAWHC